MALKPKDNNRNDNGENQAALQAMEDALSVNIDELDLGSSVETQNAQGGKINVPAQK